MNPAPNPHGRARSVLRRIGAGVFAVGLGLATLATVLVTGATQSSAAPVADVIPGGVSSVATSDGDVVVAVVLGQSGTDAADALAPYEVFARSSHFTTYTVAASINPVPLNGGLSVVPTYTFGDVASGAAPRPDLIVVPAVNEPDGEAEAALRDFITDGYANGAQILGICAGSRVLAATGVLDGHRATSHWSRIAQLIDSRPQVHWVRGERYVQDGRITTSAGVTSGIPASLRLVQRIAGDEEAARIGGEMGYPGWTLNGPTEIPVQQFALADAGVGLNVVLPWFRPTVGVALADGVGEVDAVAPFEVASYSAASTVLPVAAGSTVTTAHGLVLLTRQTSSTPTNLDRLLLPDSGDEADRASLTAWATSEGMPAAELRTAAGRGGFDAALTDLAEHNGQAVASSTAKLIDYPTVPADLAAGPTPPRTFALLAVALVLAALAALLPRALRALSGRLRLRQAEAQQ